MFTAAQLLAMTDNEIGTHASGGYGPAKRNEFYASLRQVLERSANKADAKQSIFGKLTAVPHQPSGDAA
jgi:hypothetical protein